jgi:hypothetical protein
VDPELGGAPVRASATADEEITVSEAIAVTTAIRPADRGDDTFDASVYSLLT